LFNQFLLWNLSLAVLLGAVYTVTEVTQTVASSTELKTVGQQITVRIEKSSGFGSGVLIEKDGDRYYILTNAHVVNNSDKYSVVTPDGMTYLVDASEIVRFPGLDLAVIPFNSDRDYPVAAIGNSDRGPMKLYKIGQPWQNEHFYCQ
jgi:S1-C subfamily serine protease